VRRHKALVMSYCYSRVAHRETAEDLAQETFVRAYEALAALKNPSAFAGWVLSIAHNICIDYLRNKSRTVSLETHAEKDSHGRIVLTDKNEVAVVEKLAREEARDRILKAIDSLSEDYRVTLLLRHVGGLSCEEIADTLGISVGTVTSRLSRAHRMLREKLAGIVTETDDDAMRPR
jgi:RNA polymerase sigma-70 factor (ECF subfamily)